MTQRFDCIEKSWVVQDCVESLNKSIEEVQLTTATLALEDGPKRPRAGTPSRCSWRPIHFPAAPLHDAFAREDEVQGTRAVTWLLTCPRSFADFLVLRFQDGRMGEGGRKHGSAGCNVALTPCTLKRIQSHRYCASVLPCCYRVPISSCMHLSCSRNLLSRRPRLFIDLLWSQ